MQVDTTKFSAFLEEQLATIKLHQAFESTLQPDYFKTQSLENLKLQNETHFKALLPHAYATNPINPVYAASIYGDDLGQIVSYLSALVEKAYGQAFTHQADALTRTADLLEATIKQWSVKPNDVDTLKVTIAATLTNQLKPRFHQQLKETYGYQGQTNHAITLDADLSDPRYLFSYGIYISEHELRTATFLNNFDDQELSTLALAIAKAYVSGFKRDNKDITLRHQVRIIANAGQERLTRLIISYLADFNLVGYVTTVGTTEYNQQVSFDHKFDDGLYLDHDYNQNRVSAYQQVASELEAELRDYSGILLVERFGESPFSPVNNDKRIKLSENQQGLHQAFQVAVSQVQAQYIPETERSFCIVAFPTPEIGDEFEAIFHDVMAINQMDSEAHERIQQVIIDALDHGDYVHVKGYRGNLTDIKVKLNTLENPKTQTNFVNCVADVNIPVGEVFTSPVLKGTNGVLHLDTVYLENFNYKDLHLTFENGCISNYTCANFDDDEKNQEYVRENLLFPHHSLPIGEFAIGTNTLAYAISEKYGIVDKLPVLIVEKMGPHFAIGDTCFSWGEDNPVYNPLDGKEIMAKDNERSILRKDDVTKAYTNCHTDITIPYDSLEWISVIKPNGETIDIIRKGRFVLAGTEGLNEPLDGLTVRTEGLGARVEGLDN